MERRREARFATDKSARVTILGGTKTSLCGRVINASGRGLRILLDRPIPVNTAVRVDLDDHLLLGEVCYATPEGGGFAVGLALDQVLHEVSEVARLVDAILGEAPHPTGNPQPVEDADGPPATAPVVEERELLRPVTMPPG